MAQFTRHLYGSIMVDSSINFWTRQGHSSFFAKFLIDFQCSEILTTETVKFDPISTFNYLYENVEKTT